MSLHMQQTPTQQLPQRFQIKIVAFGAIQPLLAADVQLQYDHALSINTVLEQLKSSFPAAAAMLDRCACAIGEDIVSRQDLLKQDTSLVLLSPVAGG